MYRSGTPNVFSGKGVLKIWRKSTGEHSRWSVISMKLLCIFSEHLFKGKVIEGCFWMYQSRKSSIVFIFSWFTLIKRENLEVLIQYETHTQPILCGDQTVQTIYIIKIHGNDFLMLRRKIRSLRRNICIRTIVSSYRSTSWHNAGLNYTFPLNTYNFSNCNWRKWLWFILNLL